MTNDFVPEGNYYRTHKLPANFPKNESLWKDYTTAMNIKIERDTAAYRNRTIVDNWTAHDEWARSIGLVTDHQDWRK